jgi:tryptophan synthase alpha chain
MKLSDKFTQLKEEGKKAFIAYVPFGFPSLAATKDICLTLQRSGVDIIELGLPFSDPLADGPIIQKATTKALANGANLDVFFKTVKDIIPKLEIPVVAMTYYNPILQYGLAKFLKNLNNIGIDAVIVVDLPLEEGLSLINQAKRFSINIISFITPVTNYRRAKKIVAVSSGFIYYVSLTGITGPNKIKTSEVGRHVRSIKKMTKTPVCVGFGIHTRQQVLSMQSCSDGAIVGSSIVEYIDAHHQSKNFLKKLENYVKGLCWKQ